MLPVNEIFSSIEGEGIRTGYPVTFIRLYGCNIHCPYCDTRYACEGGEFTKMSVKDIVNTVEQFGFNKVTITGGEPLVHKNIDTLIFTLIQLGYEVNIETNGTIYVGPYTDFDNVILTVDYKSSSSGMSEKMDLANLWTLRKQDVLKFVVGNKEDLEEMKNIISISNPVCSIFVSPVFGQITPKEIVEFVKENKLQQCRVQVQLHKIIWDPKERGV